MVSDSWETSQTLRGDAVLCQDHHEIKMKDQMSIFSIICMLFVIGLTRIQDGGKIPISSHCKYSIQLISFVFKILTTMPREDDGDGPRGQLPPFTPPRFNWNQDNLYEQFKNFKRVVEFAFKG